MNINDLDDALGRSTSQARTLESVQLTGAVGCRSWFLVYTKTWQEKIASANLVRQKYESFLPLNQLKRMRFGLINLSIVTLFPRFLLVCFSAECDKCSPIHSTTSVCNHARFGAYGVRSGMFASI